MAQLTQQDHDFLVEELRSGELSPEEQDRAMDLIEEFRASKQPPAPQEQPGGFKHPAGEAGRAVVAQVGAVGSGIANTALDAAEFMMLGARGIYDSVPGPEADERIAMLNRGRQQVRELRQNMNRHAEEGMGMALGTREFPKAGQFVGEMLAWWPVSRAMQGKNFKQIVGFGTLEGALAGGVGAAQEAEDFVDTLDSATMGALFSAGASSTLMSGAGLTSFMARKYRDTLRTKLGADTLELEREVQELTGNKDFHFTVGDIAADNPWMAGLQVASGKAMTLDRQVRNMRALEQFMLARSANLSPREVVQQLHNTMNKAATQMQDIANTRYSAGLDQLAAKYGDSIQVDGRLYRGALKEYIEEYKDAVDRGLAGGVPQILARHFDWLTKKVIPYESRKIGKEWVVLDTRSGKPIETYDNWEQAASRAAQRNENEGGLSIEDTRVVLREFNKFISGPTGAFDDAAGSLGEMGKALKAKFLQSLSGQSSAAVRDLSAMNKRYQFDMSQLDALKRNALGHIFGSKEELTALLSNPQAALDRLIRETGDPKAMQATRKLLEVHAPDLLVDLKKAVIQNILRGSKRAETPSAISRIGGGRFKFTGEGTELDLAAFASALQGGSGRGVTTGKVGLGLFTPGEQRELIRVGQALQVLNNTYMTRAMQDTAGTAADIAINVVSQTSEFMTRLLVRLTAKGNTVEQLMVDPKARKLVLELAARKPDSPKFKMALASLAYHIGAWDAAADREQREREQEELRQQTLDNPATSLQPGLR